MRDASGNINNYCDLGAFRHNDTEPIDYERRASNPALPYTQVAPDIDDYTRGPPKLPPHLRDIILNSPAHEEDPRMMRTPQHVTLNHLYCTAFRDGLMVQGTTQRYKRKFVTTVFYSAATQFSTPQSATGVNPGSQAAAGPPQPGNSLGGTDTIGASAGQHRDPYASAPVVASGGSGALGASPGHVPARRLPAPGARGADMGSGSGAGQGRAAMVPRTVAGSGSALESQIPSVASDVAMTQQ